MFLCAICNRYAISLNAEGKCRQCAKKDHAIRRSNECQRRLSNISRMLIGDIGA